MSMQKNINGVIVRYLPGTGRVFKMSDRSMADALVTAGHLTYKFYGPSTYGHIDYFIA